MPYHTDQEVSVKVTPVQKGDKFVVRVDAMSLDHTISRIIIWDSNGDVASRRNLTPTDNSPVKNQAGPDRVIHNHKSYVATSSSSPVDSFPICVDIYESPGVDEDEGDVHRHGWLSNTGSPVPAKNHPVDPDKKKYPNWKGFYPTISEHTIPSSGEIKSPGAFVAP